MVCSNRALSPYVSVRTFRYEKWALLHMLLKLTVFAFVPEDEGGWGMRKVDSFISKRQKNSHLCQICTEYVLLCLRMWYRKLLAL